MSKQHSEMTPAQAYMKYGEPRDLPDSDMPLMDGFDVFVNCAHRYAIFILHNEWHYRIAWGCWR